MRVSVALFPAALVTLALFCLMQYLITGSRPPMALPDVQGFVRLIHLQHPPDPQDTAQARRALPEQPKLPEETLPSPQALTATAWTPDFPKLPVTRPELATLDLAHGPYLARPEKPAIATRPKPVPDPGATQKSASAPAAEMRPVSMMSVQPPATSGITGPAGELTGSSGDNEVIPLFRIDPDYPRKAARAGQEGWVKIEFTITEHGTVVDPVVIEARPRRVFNRSALSAIRKWQFRPKLADGKPVSRRVSQVIEFKLANR